ncbi:uncharacterized protein FOMMEDRAFT_164214 [Fomitiporia mediterranea MF3/22]|uniref:Uncharacterized protein n=1 Tax=Fomitiporia mediterranea (strain MF3/22) TaxID=694068 RepID=R7SI76_FOMME|nr:uncharacterized protein FOMMEDRAFT_164214 [Fomitiporia mediterranea MF3/22]EJC97269.1 hypothetical protein FOMMEDRAFT_164214 [Fomitiporia mediterranea MF3/22]
MICEFGKVREQQDSKVAIPTPGLFDSLLPCVWSMLMLETGPISEVTFLYNIHCSTPELMIGDNTYHRDKVDSTSSTPIITPRAQSVDVQFCGGSLTIVPPGMIEDITPPNELMGVRDERARARARTNPMKIFRILTEEGRGLPALYLFPHHTVS